MSDLCSTADAAVILGMDEDQVRALVRNGTLPAEARAGGASLWTRGVLERWNATGRPSGVLPPAPRLEVIGLREIANRFRVSDAACKRWIWNGGRGSLLPEPTWRCAGMMLWSREAFDSFFPLCPSCEMSVDVVDSKHVNGQPTLGLCSCGEWVPMRPRKVG